ncbi:MAG: hypothetical protein AB8B97_11615 [Granulosicoccus sp.]
MQFLPQLKPAPASGAYLFLLVIAWTTATGASTANPLNCASQLDATVALGSNPGANPESIAARFAALEDNCPAFAQLAHNQGVLAARSNQWPQAIAHFKRALAKDQRAADTHRHLQQIFEYRAAQAYARALDTPLTAQPPQLDFQDSSARNAESEQQFPEHEQLRDIATIEYELFAWWQAQQTWAGISSHYVEGYDIEAIRLFRQEHTSRQWPDIKREIAFTQSDAVVVLSDAAKAHTLLLMRLTGTRWKIYQETRL